MCWQRIDMGANRFVGNLGFLLSMPYLVEIHLDGNMHTGQIPPVLSGPLQVSLNPTFTPQGLPQIWTFKDASCAAAPETLPARCRLVAPASSDRTAGASCSSLLSMMMSIMSSMGKLGSMRMLWLAIIRLQGPEACSTRLGELEYLHLRALPVRAAMQRLQLAVRPESSCTCMP